MLDYDVLEDMSGSRELYGFCDEGLRERASST
jgi:hypothetical protein